MKNETTTPSNEAKAKSPKAPRPNGHKTRFIAEVKAHIKIGDMPAQDFDLSYDVTVTIEHVAYLVSNVAQMVASAASKVAEAAQPQERGKSQCPECSGVVNNNAPMCCHCGSHLIWAAEFPGGVGVAK